MLAQAKVDRLTLKHGLTDAEELTNAKKELAAVTFARERADSVFEVAAKLAGKETGLEAGVFLGKVEFPIIDASCYKAAMAANSRFCGSMDDYSMKYSSVLAHMYRPFPAQSFSFPFYVFDLAQPYYCPAHNNYSRITAC